MIQKINLMDLDIIYNMGSLYDEDFRKKYNLDSYINNDIYIMNCYKENELIKGFIIANKLYENNEILLVYVAEKYRKQGIASKLINSLDNKKGNNILLEVSVENKPAICLYKKLGFDTIDIRKKYYNGVDAYIMKKVI